MAVNDFINVAVQTLNEQIAAANAVADKVINADNANKLIHEVRNTSDDETIVKFRTWLDKANNEILQREQQIDQYIVSQGLVNTSPVDVASETENYKGLAAQVKGMLGAVKAIPGGEDALKDVPELKSLPGVRKTTSGTSGGGTGTRRPRLSAITVDYGDGNKVDVFETKTDEKTKETRNVTNMTVLSGVLSSKFETKVNVQDLQQALFSAAGTEDLNTLDGKPVEFAFSVGDKNVMVTATPNQK